MKAFSNKLTDLRSSLEKNKSALKNKAGRTVVNICGMLSSLA